MKKLLLFLLLVNIQAVFPQHSMDDFPFIGWGDPNYQASRRGPYDAPLTGAAITSYENNGYYYEELDTLGLTHVVTLGNAAFLNNNPVDDNYLMILDANFLQFPWEDDHPGYLLTGYAYAQGNEPGYNPYHVGGNELSGMSSTTNWGYGDDNDEAIRFVRINGTSDEEPGVNFIEIAGTSNTPGPVDSIGRMSVLSYYQSRQPGAAGDPNHEVEYILAIRCRINNTFIPLESDENVFYIDIKLHDTETEVLHDFQTITLTRDQFEQKGGSVEGSSGGSFGTLVLDDDAGITYDDDYPIRKVDDDLGDAIENMNMQITFGGFNNCDISIDHFSLYDTFYDELFVSGTETAADIVDDIESHFTIGHLSDQRFEHLYIDEPHLNSYRALGLINAGLNTEGRDLINGAAGNYQDDFLHSALRDYNRGYTGSEAITTHLPYVMSDIYPFSGTTSHDDIEDTPAGTVFTRSIQDALDILIEDGAGRGLDPFYDYSRGFNEGVTTNMISLIQVAARHVWTDEDEHRVHLRAPTYAEIQVQGWLSICYGAKGLGFYQVHSTPPITDPTGTNFDGYYGLFDATDRDGTADEYIENLTNPANTTNLTKLRTTQRVTNDRYTAVQDLIDDIGLIDSTLLLLDRENVYSIHESPSLSSELITGIETYDASNNNSLGTDYVELGFFSRADAGFTDGNYVVIVNRRCESGLDSTRIECTLSSNSGAYWIEDVATHEIMYEDGGDSFSMTLDPGKGNLYRIIPSTATAISFDENIIVPSGETVNIEAVSNNVTVSFSGGHQVVVEGELNINQTSTNEITFDFNSSSVSRGIEVKSGASCAISNTTIREALSGVRYYSSVSSSLDDVTIVDCYSGVYAYGADSLTIENSFIQDCHWGVTLDNSDADIISTTFDAPMRRGVYAVNSSLATSSYLNSADNLFADVDTALCAYGSSLLHFGLLSSGDNDENCFQNGDKKAAAYSSAIFMERNRWYPNLPLASEFVRPNGETIRYGYSLGSCAGRSAGGQSAVVSDTVEMSKEDEMLSQFLLALNDAGKSDLTGLFNSFVAAFPESHMIPFMISKMVKRDGKDVESAVRGTLSGIAEKSRKDRMEEFLAIELAVKTNANPVSSLEAVYKATEDEATKEYALYQLVMQAANVLFDEKMAASYAEKFEEEFPGSYRNELINLTLPSGQAPTSAGKAVPGMKKGLELEEKAVEEVEAIEALPEEYQLYDAFPNPFNPSTTIRYALPFDSFVKVSVFDINGNLIRELQHGNRSAGYYETVWDGRNDHNTSVVSGVYIYRIDAVSQTTDHQYFTESKKMILVK